ncbi:unnamed protein product [Dovyalis caffra]|uniref:Uncharacterized protein n=1 Tax=Dovyalis caffra TaxID=77055 RepID=A0AAV1QMB7_9ROSI|nr:unnamed protein product [Dovyalis caffra]
MEAPLLNEFKKEDGDYLPVRSLKDIKSVFWEETVKMWELAGPVIITLLCQFGIISSIAMFVGHLGDLELSAVSISLTVIGTFSYGFLVLWYMTSIVILTGHLDNSVVAVDSLSICMLMNNWENVLFIGINAAISVRVSNELGLGHAVATKYSVYVTVFQSLVIGLVFMVVVLFAKDYIAIFFTSSKIMQESVSKLAFLLSITMVLNSVQPVISGVAVGGGWQALVAYINIGNLEWNDSRNGFADPYASARTLQNQLEERGSMTNTKLVDHLQVEQSTERMKKWAGKDVTEFSSVDWK